jgi:glycosyltransferase 2 family protein
MKNLLSLLFRIGLSGALLYYLFTKIDTTKTLEVLKSADLVYIFYGITLFMLIHGIVLWRWFIFIRAVDLTVSIKEVIRYFFIGLFGNLFLPSSIGGDVIKIIGLCKGSAQKSRVVASILLDRLSGFAGIVLVSTSVFFLGYKFVNDATLLIPIGIILIASLCVAAVLFNEKIYSICCIIFNIFPKVKKSLMDMHYDIALLKDNPNEGFKAIGLGCLSQIMFAVTWFFVAKALHQDISVIYFIIFVPLLCVVTMLPSIGGLGVREAGAAYLFVRVGMDSGVAVGLSLITFLFMIIMGLIGAVVYVFTLSSGRVQHNPSNSRIPQPKA